MFSNCDLKNIILPLFLEQLLLMLVGTADTFVVSFVGEAAVSGVSLVNSFNTIFIYLFTALASGGAVIISQYIGNNRKDISGETASQLLTASTVLSVVITLLIFAAHKHLMSMLFGRVDADVMNEIIIYLKISLYSYPALAVYNAGAALYRSLGKTRVTMYISVISNMINIIGNIIGVFILKAGVAGVAYPSLIARTFSAAVITMLCFMRSNSVKYAAKYIFEFNGGLLKKILNIAVPNCIDSGIFQLVKVALSSVVALFGTYQIAANGIAQSIWSLASLVCVAMGPVFITVIGQCMGAGKVDEAEYYLKKLMKITLVFAVIWNILIFAFTPVLMLFYNVADETKHLVILLVLVHNIFSGIVFPFADPLSRGLRATGDAKFTMLVSVMSTVFGRLVFSLIFGITLDLGVMGIAYAMCLDWSIRAVVFYVRFRHGKWKTNKVI